MAGAADMPAFEGLDLRHFQETRDNEYSLDRLGRSGLDKAVVRYLTKKAEDAGTRFRKPKPFSGWITARSSALAQGDAGKPINLVASPILEDGDSFNEYHAHAVRPTDQEDYFFALHLRHCFAKHGKKLENSNAETSWFGWLKKGRIASLVQSWSRD